jgi:outer membrane protein TolC
MMMGHHDVLRAESEIEALKAERVSLETERDAIVAMLNRLRGQPQTSDVGDAHLPSRKPLPSLASVLAQTGKRPELEGMRWMRAEMVAQRDVARRMYWPMLMIEGEYEQRTDGMPDGLGGAVVLSLPLWFWDGPRNEVAMANAMVRRSERELAAMTSMTEADLRMAWSRALAAERRLDALEKSAIPKMKETISSTESAYSAGSADFLSLLDANLSLLELEGARLEAVRTLEIARYELSRLVGVPLSEMGR